MVKGNWERRIELANARRTEAKQKKVSRSIKNTPIQSIVTTLQKYLPIDSIITIWLADNLEDACCSQWLRLGFCENKKCRLPHEPFQDILSKAQGIQPIENDDEVDYICQNPIKSSVWELTDEEMITRILFISDDKNNLIYDHIYPQIWSNYRITLQHQQKSSTTTTTTTTTTTISTIISTTNSSTTNNYDTKNIDSKLNKVCISDIKEDSSEQIISNIPFTFITSPLLTATTDNYIIGHNNTIGNTVITSQYTQDQLTSIKIIWYHMLSYLDAHDTLSFIISSKVIKTICYHDTIIKKRRKEILTTLQTLQLQQKQEEKKRRQKQAFLKKNDKKDGFARGGSSGH